ncbi:MAG: hypothetical protein MJ252_26305 [archaeon]|nr:hypothetical protein [archaeon]
MNNPEEGEIKQEQQNEEANPEETKNEGEEGAEEAEKREDEQKEPEPEPVSATISDERYTHLSRDDFNREIIKNWSRIIAKSPPKRRSWHSSFMYQEKYLYIIGGVDITDKKQNDIYRIDLSSTTPEWEKVEITEGELQPIAYQSGALLNDIYYIIGGQDKEMNPINLIQKIDAANNKILPPETPSEEDLPPIESHTVEVYNNGIYIYGGITPNGINRDVYLITFEDQNQNKEEQGNEGENRELGDEGEEAKPEGEGEAKPEGEEEAKPEGEEERPNEEPEEEEKENKKVEEEKKTEGGIKIINLTKDLDAESMPKPRKSHCTIVKGNQMYIYGGLGEGNEVFGDLWIFNLDDHTFTEVPMNTEDPKTFPKPRNGAKLFLVGEDIFLFGGKNKVIKETNELWKFDVAAQKFVLIHDTLIEAFTEEELEKCKKEMMGDKKVKKGFRLLTRAEVEKRNNPSPFDAKTLKDSKSKEENKTKKEEEKNQKKDKKKDEKTGDLGSNAKNMKCSKIYIANTADNAKTLKNLDAEEKTHLSKDVVKIIGNIPEPRDGMTMDIYNGKAVIFGGDRNKFPFNDIFFFDLNITCEINKAEPDQKEEVKEEEGQGGAAEDAEI